MDAAHRSRNSNNLNDKTLSTSNHNPTAYMTTKSTAAASSLLPAFNNQSRNSHLPTPQSPNPLQLNGYTFDAQQSPDSRYLASSRPGSAHPPYTPQRNVRPSGPSHMHQAQPFTRMVASEPRQKVPPNHAIVTPSPELSRARLPNDTLMTPTPKLAPSTASGGPPTGYLHPAHPHPPLHSPGLSSTYQSSPELQQTRSPARRRQPRQRTMSIDEPETPVFNLNLPLAKHGSSGAVQHAQSCQDDAHHPHHPFDHDDPFIEPRADQSSVLLGERSYPGDGNMEGYSQNTQWRRRSSYPHASQVQYAEPSLGESSFLPSDPQYLVSKRPASPNEQATRSQNYSRRNTDSPLTPCPATPPPPPTSTSSRILNESRSGTPSPVPPSSRRVKLGHSPSPTSMSPSRRLDQPRQAVQTASPSSKGRSRHSTRTAGPGPSHASLPVDVDVGAGADADNGNGADRRDGDDIEESLSSQAGGELTRIRALRVQLEAERAAACEPHRPDYLVRVERGKDSYKKMEVLHDENENENEDVSDLQRVTPVKRRDLVATDSKRKRARLDVNGDDHLQSDSSLNKHDSDDDLGTASLGIVKTPTRGRRLALYQQSTRNRQDSGGGPYPKRNLITENVDSRTPPLVPSVRASPGPSSPPPSVSKTRTGAKSPDLEPVPLSSPLPAPPPYTLALRSINWHTPGSNRVGNSSTPDHNHNGNDVTLLEEDQEQREARRKSVERRLAIKERRLAAFRATKPSGRGDQLRSFELVGGNGGRIIINCVSDDIIGLMRGGVIVPEDTKLIRTQMQTRTSQTDDGVTAPSSLVADWPENIYPWSKAAEQRAERAEKERQRRLAYIERYLDRDSESENEEDLYFGMSAGGVDLLLAYDDTSRKGGDREDNITNDSPSKDKERKARGGNRATTKKPQNAPLLSSSSSSSPTRPASITPITQDASFNTTQQKSKPRPVSRLRATIIPPISTADARFALFSRKRVRLLAEKLRMKEEEGVVMCICQGGDDGRPMVRCDRCRGWYHLVCVDIHDAKELEDEWFCFKCAGDEEEEDGAEHEEGEEEEEPGVAYALENRFRTRMDAFNANMRTGTGTHVVGSGTSASGKLSKKRHHHQGEFKHPDGSPGKNNTRTSNSKAAGLTSSTTTTMARRRRKMGSGNEHPPRQRQQKQQKVPDFAPAMPESPVRPGAGDQMLYQIQHPNHQMQMFSLQASPMIPLSPRRRTPGISPSRRGGGGGGGHDAGYVSSSSSAFLATPSTGSLFGQFSSRMINDRSRSRSRSRDRASGSRHTGSLHHATASTSTFNANTNANEPSTPRRSISKSLDNTYPSYSSSSPSKLGPPLYLTTPKPSYDDAPFDPTSTPSRGLTFSAPGGGPATPISSARGGVAGSSGRYGHGYNYNYGYGGGGSGGSNLAPPPSMPIWGTPRTPTGGSASASGRLGTFGSHHDAELYPNAAWGSGWGDESPVRRSCVIKTDRTSAMSNMPASSTSTMSTPFASSSTQNQNQNQRSALLDSPFAIGSSASASASASGGGGSVNVNPDTGAASGSRSGSTATSTLASTWN